METHLQATPFDGVKTIEETCDALHRVAGENGLPYFSYVQLKSRTHTDRFIANYPQEWRQRYEEKLYIHYDPVVAVGRRSRLPFFWDNSGFISPYRKAQRKVFHEAGCFGINTGYSIPIAGQPGELALFSVAAATEKALMNAVNGSAHLIYVLALQLHDHVFSLHETTTEVHQEVSLTARELECLKWTAEGLTTEQIAERMAISAATVNYHFSKIIPKFGALNRHHATIMAVRHRLI